MKVLVAGGLGFIGSHFVEFLAKNHPEDAVSVLDANTYAATSLEFVQELIPQSQIHHGHIGDVELILQGLPKFDVIVNFAAESHNDNAISSPTSFWQTNTLEVDALARFALRHGSHFHQVSTDEVFGDLPLESLEEFHLGSPYNPSNPYSASKAAGDMLVRSYGRTFGLKYTISNCTNNFGARQHPEKFLPKSISMLKSGMPPVVYGRGRNIRDWINVKDHVRGIDQVLRKGVCGQTYLFGARDRVSNLQIVTELLAIFGKPDDFISYVEDRPGHDRRYALNPDYAEKTLKWHARQPRILKSLERLVEDFA